MADPARSTESEADREFVMTRVFDAPRSLVYRAWTDPQHMARWWGPHHFTNPVCELDVRPGGAFLIVMRGPDGSEFPCRGIYREVSPPARLVYTDDHSGMPDMWHDWVDPSRDKSAAKPALESVTTVTFDDLGGKTRLTLRTLFASVAVRDAMLKIQMAEGWAQSLERLESLLAEG
jgi:uncharacterized protein YndB with AHSA1/START domain